MLLCRISMPVLLILAACTGIAGASELPLTPTSARGQTVTPSFEGWYMNPDGSYTLSFGYFNRNTEEIVQIPSGPDNFIEPGDANQGQPTVFLPRRHWGAFGVKVPADFGYGRVVWTLRLHGQTFAIPGSLARDTHYNTYNSCRQQQPPVIEWKACRIKLFIFNQVSYEKCRPSLNVVMRAAASPFQPVGPSASVHYPAPGREHDC